MRKSKRLNAFLLIPGLLAAAALPAIAAAGGYTLFGNATYVSPGHNSNRAVQLVSNANTGVYSGIDFTVPAGLTINNLNQLSTDYNFTAASCALGSPRFGITLASNPNAAIFVYIGPPPNYTGCPPNVWTNTGNLLTPTSLVDATQYGGAFYEPWATVQAAFSGQVVTDIFLVSDNGSGTGGSQTVLIDNTDVNGTLYTYEPAPALADPSEPGSIIVYQKFQRGFVTVDAGLASQSVQPRSLIELGATCPKDDTTCGVDIKVVRVNFHWVCPPQPDNSGAQFAATGGGVCVENDFFVNLTVNGKVWFSPEGGFTSGDLPGQIVPQAPCNRGYLIGFVSNIGRLEGDNTAVFANSDAPIRFDGLIGDAVMRNTPQDLQAFRAITIQADPNTAEETALTGNGTAGPDSTGVGTLVIDGNLGNYDAVTGQLSGDVRYDSDVNPPFADTALIFLTLDVKSNQKNLPTFVNLVFYNAQQAGFSEALSFTCWGQINITTIDASLTQEGVGTERGLFITSQAYSATIANGGQSGNADGTVTMLGAVQITEGPISGPANATRSYTVPVFDNSVPIATRYLY
jgi:hypothetical protein